jgi:hypothetical protein
MAEVDLFSRRHRAIVQVLPRAETATCAGQHKHPRIAEPIERIGNFAVHLDREAVEPLRPVQRQRAMPPSLVNSIVL